MKDSGVEWIGEIPEEWEIVRIKNIAKGEDALFDDGDWIESSVIENDGIRYLTTGNVGEGTFKEQGDGFVSEKTISDLNCLLAYPGDLVISRLNKPIGRACRLPDTYDRYVVAVDIAILRPEKNRYCRDYLMFAMCIDGYSEDANMISRGATMPRISRTQLGRLTLPSPTYKEQKRISEYLNVNVAHINTIIEKTKESIEEYKKYKQSLITEVVTKGLNPEVPMRDSGVEWIGEIPEHWKIINPHKVCEVIRGNCTFQKDDLKNEGHYVALQYGKTYKVDEVNDSYSFFVDGSFYKENQVVTSGCTILVSTSETMEDLGHSCYYDREDHALLGGEQMCLKPKELVVGKFLYYASRYLRFELNQFATGLKVYRFRVDDLKKANIVVPPVEEQKEIVAFLDQQIPIIESVVSSKMRIITELESYKKSLIYEVVTGKKEIQ